MIAQCNNSLSVLPVARVQFPATAEYFKGFFRGWSHSANPSWASVAENGSISPQWHHTTCGQRGGRPKSNHGQTMADRKSRKKGSFLQTLTVAIAATTSTQTSGRLCLLSVHPDVWSAMFACQFTQTSGRLCLPVSCVFLEQFFARPVISDSSLIISAFLAFSPMVTDYLISNPCIRCTSRDKPSHLVKVTHILHRWDRLPMHDTRNKTVIISPISVSKCDDSRAWRRPSPTWNFFADLWPMTWPML